MEGNISMEMKLKLGEVINLNHVLKKIIDENKKMDAVFKFKLLGIMKAIESHISNFEVIRNEKILEYGKKTEDGSVNISPDDKEAIKKFNESIEAVINNEVTINVEKLKSEDVFSKDFNVEELIALYPIIKE